MVNLKDRSEDTMRKIYHTEEIGKRGKTTHKLLSTVTLIFLCFSVTTSLLAQTEFTGNLNSVSITDAAGINSPPVANFTYTQNGDTFTFDASGSSDSDGSITVYKWDFGDGTTGTGVNISHLFRTRSAPVTLMVLDNQGGISLRQIMSTKPLIAHFKFDAPGGLNNDQVFDEISQSWMGAGAASMEFSPGLAGNSIKAAQRDDAIILPSALVTNRAIFTLEFDVKYTNIERAGTLFPVAFNKLGSSNSLFFNSSYSVKGPRIYFSKSYSEFYHYFDRKFEPSSDTWVNYKIIVDFPNSAIEIFLNNTSMGIWTNQGITPWGDTAGNFRIAFNDSTTSTSFYIDNVKIY